MVLFVSCPTSSVVSTASPVSCHPQDFYNELTCNHSTSQPIPVSQQPTWNCGGDYSTSPLERRTSPLATSAESVDSIKSSCSSRSSAERDMERVQRRHLLNLSLEKMSSQSNMPLRKHLLVFNTVKALQRDLEILDDEDLFCSLMGMSNETMMVGGAETVDMEIEEGCWLKQDFLLNRQQQQQQQQQQQRENVEKKVMLEENITSTITTSTMDDNRCDSMKKDEMIGAPPKQEELESHSIFIDQGIDDFEMDDIEMGNGQEATKTWSWSNESSLFDLSNGSKNDSIFSSAWKPKEDTFSMWLEGDGCESMMSGGGFPLGILGGGHAAASSTTTGEFDLWGMMDPMGASKFDLRHLFPSQLLLQA